MPSRIIHAQLRELEPSSLAGVGDKICSGIMVVFLDHNMVQTHFIAPTQSIKIKITTATTSYCEV
jgi:hypothetical protein